MILPFIHLQQIQPIEQVKIETRIVIPFYSQFKDIESVSWRNKSCGIASLAMIINYYRPGTITPQQLLIQGINSGAYVADAGWSHQGLINLAQKYDLVGETYYLTELSSSEAFDQFNDVIKEGPAIVSIHYKFDPKNPIPHLVVITNIEGDTVYYNDPATDGGNKEISVDQFKKAWKKRFITIRDIKNLKS